MIIDNNNHIIDMLLYKLELLYVTIEAMTENMISDHCVSQIDEEGHCWLLLYEIIDHSRGNNYIRKE